MKFDKRLTNLLRQLLNLISRKDRKAHRTYEASSRYDKKHDKNIKDIFKILKKYMKSDLLAFSMEKKIFSLLKYTIEKDNTSIPAYSAQDKNVLYSLLYRLGKKNNNNQWSVDNNINIKDANKISQLLKKNALVKGKNWKDKTWGELKINMITTLNELDTRSANIKRSPSPIRLQFKEVLDRENLAVSDSSNEKMASITSNNDTHDQAKENSFAKKGAIPVSSPKLPTDYLNSQVPYNKSAQNHKQQSSSNINKAAAKEFPADKLLKIADSSLPPKLPNFPPNSLANASSNKSSQDKISK